MEMILTDASMSVIFSDTFSSSFSNVFITISNCFNACWDKLVFLDIPSSAENSRCRLDVVALSSCRISEIT